MGLSVSEHIVENSAIASFGSLSFSTKSGSEIDDAGAKAAEAEIEQATAASRDGTETPANVRVPLESLVGADQGGRVVHCRTLGETPGGNGRQGDGRDHEPRHCRRLYEEIKSLRPEWHDPDDDKGMMKVVVTGGPDDPELLRSHVRTKEARKRLAERFKNPQDDFRLVIVVDMWLTGFDVPCAHTLYLDKPLAGHNLMQAIARVNERKKPRAEQAIS